MARADDGFVPFLSYERVPDELWEALEPGQRALHLLWAKMFVPLYENEERIRPEDVGATDRRIIRAVLEAVAWRRLPFQRPVTYQSSEGDVAFLHAQSNLLDERTTFVLVVRTSSHRPDEGGRISLHAQSLTTDIEVILEWRPQDDPQRGSILLYPQAAKSRRRFAIAAFNRDQFAGICQAFVDYCAPRTDCKERG